MQRWILEGVRLLPPETDEDIREAFYKLGVSVQSDLVHLYSTIGGMSEMDNQYWRLWPLTEILEWNGKSSEILVQHGLVFADFLLDSHHFRVKSNGNDSSVYIDGYNDKPPRLVARSLVEFFDAYVTDPDKVLDI